LWSYEYECGRPQSKMNKDELTKIAQAFEEPLGQVALALIEIVQTLKQQPQFDRLSFDRQIEEQIRKMEEDSLTKAILQSTLG
jgi:hypothetical protein